MATHYDIYIKADNGETFSDTVTFDIKAEVASLATHPDFELGKKISAKRSKNIDDELVTMHTYENGFIKVTRRLNQLTYLQRTGQRKH